MKVNKPVGRPQYKMKPQAVWIPDGERGDQASVAWNLKSPPSTHPGVLVERRDGIGLRVNGDPRRLGRNGGREGGGLNGEDVLPGLVGTGPLVVHLEAIDGRHADAAIEISVGLWCDHGGV
jgi:hypothetical protein